MSCLLQLLARYSYATRYQVVDVERRWMQLATQAALYRSSSTIITSLSGRSVPDQWDLISWPGTNLGW